MTYEQFKNKYNGQYLDWDSCYGPQCWDLAQYYFTECLGVPASVLSGCGGVKNMLYSPKREQLNEYFDEVSVYEMTAGDVCIWDGWNGNEFGHIAIFDNWNGNSNWYFSQNPGASSVRECDLPSKMYAFRLRKPKPQVTPNVERDEYKNQLEVTVPNLRVRTAPSTGAEILGYASVGFYNYYETRDSDGYTWYRIADNQWVASSGEWTKIYPAKAKDKYIQFKVLSEKDGYVEIDLGKVLVRNK